jgi:hypothetical protein
MFCDSGVYAMSARLSTSIPCTVYNCVLICHTSGLSANTLGQITENYNLICAGTPPRTNVTAGAQSISDNSIPLVFEFGQSQMMGLWPRPMFAPARGMGAISNIGNNGSQTAYDFYNVPRPGGENLLISSGTATDGADKTLTDTGKTFGTNALAGCVMKLTGGTGSGQIKTIASNTATVITVDGNWTTNPSTDTTYLVMNGAFASMGQATAGGATTLTDANAAWGTNQWQGYTIALTGGTGGGGSRTVVSNTATVLTVAAWDVNPDNTTTYSIYRGASVAAVNISPGAVSATDTAQLETGTVRTGTNSLSMIGPGFQDFEIPVDASSTTVTVYTQWDAAYAGTKPAMSVLNGIQFGVADNTDTATGDAGNWEQLSLNFTPTSAGVVTIRLNSQSTANDGRCFWDDFAVI